MVSVVVVAAAVVDVGVAVAVAVAVDDAVDVVAVDVAATVLLHQ